MSIIRELSAAAITDAVERLCIEANTQLPADVKAALEKELLDAINATGFGPQGFGGATTCLGVAIEQKPTHVACLPVAVNISCHVTRRASCTL